MSSAIYYVDRDMGFNRFIHFRIYYTNVPRIGLVPMYYTVYPYICTRYIPIEICTNKLIYVYQYMDAFKSHTYTLDLYQYQVFCYKSQ